jgi:hypothetical protein
MLITARVRFDRGVAAHRPGLVKPYGCAIDDDTAVRGRRCRRVPAVARRRDPDAGVV